MFTNINKTNKITYTCYYCPKIFTTITKKDVNMRIHNVEKPYVCNQCLKAFSMDGNLKQHLKIHTGEKPYPCNNVQMLAFKITI